MVVATSSAPESPTFFLGVRSDGALPLDLTLDPQLVDWEGASQLADFIGFGESHLAGSIELSHCSESILESLLASHPRLGHSFTMNNSGVVNPGLLFDTANVQFIPGPALPSQVNQTTKDTTPSSPKKSRRSGTPMGGGINRGEPACGRPSLPPLAPRPRSQLVSNAGVNANKPVTSQLHRRSNKPSPLARHQSRFFSTLSSIPATPRLKLVIDENGRARVVEVDPSGTNDDGLSSADSLGSTSRPN